MQWTIAQARQRFSELLRQAADAPQIVTNRDRPVAAVVDAETFREFQEWKTRKRTSLAECFQELRKICREENYEFVTTDRTERANSFLDVLDELSPGH